MVVDVAKSVIFWVHFRSTSSIFDFLVGKKVLKSFLLIAKDIKKNNEKNKTFFFQNKILGKVSTPTYPPNHAPTHPTDKYGVLGWVVRV